MVPNLAIFNRIYIGSIFFELTETEIGSVFSVFGALKSVQMMIDPATKKHRGYGFLEFETPDAAALAQVTMDNAEFGGRRIKVGRPNNFPNDLPPGVPRPVPNRIYVANVHELIQEEEFESIFQAFGPLRSSVLIPDPKLPKQHRGYGYVEFEAVADAINAMTSLNHFELAGRQLKIGKTVLGGPLPVGMRSKKSSNTSYTADHTYNQPTEASKSVTVTAAQQKLLPSAVLRAAQQINAAIGSDAIKNSSREHLEKVPPEPREKLSILVLQNMANAHELSDDQSKAEIIEDIIIECSKFGRIFEGIKTYIPDQTGPDAWFFVKYTTEAECDAAVRVMNGRWFGGRQVVAKAVSESIYDTDDFKSTC